MEQGGGGENDPFESRREQEENDRRDERIRVIRQAQDDLTAFTRLLNVYISRLIELRDSRDRNLQVAESVLQEQTYFAAQNAYAFIYAFQLNPATVHFPYPDSVLPLPEAIEADRGTILHIAHNWAQNWDFERTTNPQEDAEPESDNPDSDDAESWSDGD